EDPDGRLQHLLGSTPAVRCRPVPGGSVLLPRSGAPAPAPAAGLRRRHPDTRSQQDDLEAMSPPRNLVLIAPMGAGKSAVGRQLARMLGLDFVDSDEEVERRTGVDIPFIFEKEGEAGFRRREAAVIDELTQRQGIVLATGGGAILDPDSRSRLGARGFVIYLHASVEQQLERTSKGRGRPLLENRPRAKVLAELMEVREPLYREIADLVVETDGRRVQAVAREIADAL